MGRRKYATEPVHRAFVHHGKAQVTNAFQFHGPADQAPDTGDQRLVVSINDHRENLTPREAWLVAQALAAGRTIETVLAMRRDVAERAQDGVR